MNSSANNSFLRYVLITFLAVALLSGQVFKLHIHIQHDGFLSSAPTEQAISSTHDTTYNIHHQDDTQSSYHSAEVDVSFDSFVKKISSLDVFAFLLFVFFGIIYFPKLLRLQRQFSFKFKFKFFYNLIQPPLRAPPGKTYI